MKTKICKERRVKYLLEMKEFTSIRYVGVDLQDYLVIISSNIHLWEESLVT